MRQHSDKEYADLLSNVRVGKLTDKQFGLLTERLLTPGRRASVSTICHKYNSLVADGHFPLILLPRTNLCDEINTAMLAQLGTQAHANSNRHSRHSCYQSDDEEGPPGVPEK